MVSNGFLTVTTSGQQYNIGEKPSVIYCSSRDNKSNTRIILLIVQMYNIFRLLIGVPDYNSESYREKQKLIGFIVIIPQRGVCKS